MPNRFLKGELTSSKRWNACTWKAQSLYIRLLTLVCDYGRYEADPTLLCAHAFPLYPHFRPRTVAKLLKELEANGLILLYTADDKACLQVTRWKETPRGKPRYEGPSGSQTTQETPKSDSSSDSTEHNSSNRVTPSSEQTPDSTHTPKKRTENDPPPGTVASECSLPKPKPEPEPKPISTHTGKRLHNIPASAEEVIAYGQTLHPKIPEDRCRAFWAHYEGQARTNPNGDIFWVTSGEAVITNWKVKLPPFATELKDGNKQANPRPGQQRVNRNIGTANEGQADQYRGVGRILPG